MGRGRPYGQGDTAANVPHLHPSREFPWTAHLISPAVNGLLAPGLGEVLARLFDTSENTSERFDFGATWYARDAIPHHTILTVVTVARITKGKRFFVRQNLTVAQRNKHKEEATRLTVTGASVVSTTWAARARAARSSRAFILASRRAENGLSTETVMVVAVEGRAFTPAGLATGDTRKAVTFAETTTIRTANALADPFMLLEKMEVCRWVFGRPSAPQVLMITHR